MKKQPLKKMDRNYSLTMEDRFEIKLKKRQTKNCREKKLKQRKTKKLQDKKKSSEKIKRRRNHSQDKDPLSLRSYPLHS